MYLLLQLSGFFLLDYIGLRHRTSKDLKNNKSPDFPPQHTCIRYNFNYISLNFLLQITILVLTISINLSKTPISSGNDINLLWLAINTSKDTSSQINGGITTNWFRLKKKYIVNEWYQKIICQNNVCYTFFRWYMYKVLD